MKIRKHVTKLIAAFLVLTLCLGSTTSLYAEEPAVTESAESDVETQDIAAPASETGFTDIETEDPSDTDPQTETESADPSAESEEELSEPEDPDALPPSEDSEEGSEEEPDVTGEAQDPETESEDETADEDVSLTEEQPSETEEQDDKQEETDSASQPAESAPAKAENTTVTDGSKESSTKAVSEVQEETKEQPKASSGTPVVEAAFTDATEMFYRINITGTELASGEFYRVKVWSKTNSTDDAKWTNFKKTEDGYEALITVSDYKDPGLLYARIYLYKKTESGYDRAYIQAADFTVQKPQTGTISVSSLNKTAGTAVITTAGISSPSGITSARAVVYSKSDKSDRYDYAMTKKSDGNFKASVNTANHGGNKGTYKVFVYVTDGNGFETKAASSAIDFTGSTGTLKATTNKEKNKYTIKITGFTSSYKIKSVKVGLWSETGGQDDLKWHKMNIAASGKTIAYSGYIKDFKHYGTINAHVYLVKSDGTEVLFDKTTFTTSAPKAKSVTAAANQKNGSFTVNVTDLTSEFAVKEVTAVVWTKTDKSDKKTYTLTASGSDYTLKNGTVKDFANTAGKYQIKVYAALLNGPTTLLKTTSVEFKASAGKITFADKIKKTYGKMEKNYTVTLSLPIVANGIQKVEFAVWNEKNTSKVKWYTAKKNSAGNYYTNVKIIDFKKLGQYTTHVYVTDLNGNRSYLDGAQIMNVTGTASGTLYLSECSPAKGTFAVSLKKPSAPSSVAGVQITAWTKADKSDKFTYTAKKQTDGSFKATVNIANHKYNVGTYHLQIRSIMGNGIKVLTASKDYTFKGKNNAFVLKNSEHHRLIGIDSPSSTANLKAAVWSETGGQDDLRWVALTKSGLQYTTDLDLAGFLHSGTFNVHIYAGDTHLKSITFTAEAGEAGRTGWVYENGLKYYYEWGIKKTNLTGMVGAPYQICVNRQCCTITVYAMDGGNGYIIPVIAMTCSVGLPGMETPTGYYYSDYKSRWEMLMGPSWGQYVTHVVEGIYIHSVAGSNTTSYNLSAYDYNNLGQPASHGCIRLNVRDAKWIYDNCPYGTEIYIYDSSNPGPFGKPATIKIPEGQNWDPTDPNI